MNTYDSGLIGGQQMSNKSDPRDYWNERYKSSPLKKVGSASGTSQLGGGDRINVHLYRLRKKSFDDLVSRHAIDLTAKSILDVGCGTGFWTAYFHNNCVSRYVGIDISPVVIAHCKRTFRYPRFDFYELDIGEETLRLDLPSGMDERRLDERGFDIVNSYDVLYHIVDDVKFERAIENITAVMKAGALLIVTDYFFDHQRNVAPHIRFRSLQRYKEVLSMNGLTVVEIKPVFYLLGRVVEVHRKDENHSWVTNTVLLPFYFRGWGAPVLEWIDRWAVHLVSPMSEEVKTKILVARKQ